MATAAELMEAMKPKSDQLNADDLITGPITVTITGVKVNLSQDQKVAISYQGDNGKPYKPCKGMARVMAGVWGGEPDRWVGNSMTLYRDPTIKFGSLEQGGIRISHVTGIEKDTQVLVTMKKGSRKAHLLLPLSLPGAKPKPKPDMPNPADVDRLEAGLKNAGSLEGLDKIWSHDAARKIREGLMAGDPDRCDEIDAVYNERFNALTLEEGFGPQTGEVLTGRAETDHGDQHDGVEAEAPTYQASVDDWTARALAAEHMAEINAIQKQYDLSRAVLEGEAPKVVADLDAALTAARKRIGGAQ